MQKANLRQVGGSVILAIPPAFLNQLGVSSGSEVGLTIEDDRLIIHAQHKAPRYTLESLLAQCNAVAARSEEDQAWLQSPATGSELL